MNKEGLLTGAGRLAPVGVSCLFRAQALSFLGFKVQGIEVEVFRVLGVQGFPCHEGVP